MGKFENPQPGPEHTLSKDVPQREGVFERIGKAARARLLLAFLAFTPNMATAGDPPPQEKKVTTASAKKEVRGEGEVMRTAPETMEEMLRERKRICERIEEEGLITAPFDMKNVLETGRMSAVPPMQYNIRRFVDRTDASGRGQIERNIPITFVDQTYLATDVSMEELDENGKPIFVDALDENGKRIKIPKKVPQSIKKTINGKTETISDGVYSVSLNNANPLAPRVRISPTEACPLHFRLVVSSFFLQPEYNWYGNRGTPVEGGGLQRFHPGFTEETHPREYLLWQRGMNSNPDKGKCVPRARFVGADTNGEAILLTGIRGPIGLHTLDAVPLPADNSVLFIDPQGMFALLGPQDEFVALTATISSKVRGGKRAYPKNLPAINPSSTVRLYNGRSSVETPFEEDVPMSVRELADYSRLARNNLAYGGQINAGLGQLARGDAKAGAAVAQVSVRDQNNDSAEPPEEK